MKSFTLIEILIVIGILIILITIFFPTFRSFRTESNLNNSVEQIINTLRLVQGKTLASDGASQWGIYFSTSTIPHQYTLFQGADYASRIASSDEIYNLPESVEIYDINLAAGAEVVFDRLIGSTDQFGDLSLRLKTDPTKNQTIYIENSGQAGLTPPSVPSDAGRIKDSRHVHFDLGWSIQNATIVEFHFPIIPQTEQVDMADYFNAGKTEFDWEGTFVVDGVDQTFRLHTHSLNAFNTLLCIHRDRNEERNNQEVVIYIVDGGIDKDIAHYLADIDDTVIKGFYVDTMEKQ
jgi:type II secretory pathway pseudopilin PulG